MQKFLPFLIGISLLTVLLLPTMGMAQEMPKECCTLRRPVTVDTTTCSEGQVAAPNTTAAADCTGTYCTASADQWGMFCLLSTVYYITNWIFTILLLVSVIMVIIGGFQMVTAAGSEEKFTSGRNYVMYAAIGVGVAVAARIVPAVVRAVMGI